MFKKQIGLIFKRKVSIRAKVCKIFYSYIGNTFLNIGDDWLLKVIAVHLLKSTFKNLFLRIISVIIFRYIWHNKEFLGCCKMKIRSHCLIVFVHYIFYDTNYCFLHYFHSMTRVSLKSELKRILNFTIFRICIVGLGRLPSYLRYKASLIYIVFICESISYSTCECSQKERRVRRNWTFKQEWGRWMEQVSGGGVGIDKIKRTGGGISLEMIGITFFLRDRREGRRNKETKPLRCWKLTRAQFWKLHSSQ